LLIEVENPESFNILVAIPSPSLIMDTSRHGLAGIFSGKNGLGLYSCPLVQLGG